MRPAPRAVAPPGRKVGRRRRAEAGRGGPVHGDAARAEGRGVERGDVDEGPVLASSPHRLRRNVDAAVRVAERRHDLGPDFVPLPRDRRAERGTEILRPDATGGESVERRVEDARDCAPPAGVDGGDPARHGVGENDRHAVGGGHREEDVRLAGQEAVAFSEEGVPALSRGCFEGKNAAAVHLLQRDDLGVRRAEASRKGAARAVGGEGAGGQRSSRESRREPGNAAERELLDGAGRGRARRRLPIHILILRNSLLFFDSRLCP